MEIKYGQIWRENDDFLPQTYKVIAEITTSEIPRWRIRNMEEVNDTNTPAFDFKVSIEFFEKATLIQDVA